MQGKTVFKPMNLRSNRRAVVKVGNCHVVVIETVKGKRGTHLLLTLPDGSTIRYESLTPPSKSA